MRRTVSPLSALMVACWRLALTAEYLSRRFRGRRTSFSAGPTELWLLIAEALLQGVKRGVAVLRGLFAVTVDPPEMFLFQDLRWRMASDTTGSEEGSRVDDVIVHDSDNVRPPTPRPVSNPAFSSNANAATLAR